MESGIFRTTVLKLFILILLPVAMFATSAEAQRKRGYQNPLEVSVGLPGGRAVQLSSTNINLSDGVTLTGSYKPARFFNLAAVLTHYANASAANFQSEKTKFGIGVFVATPWARLYSRDRRLGFVHWRGKIAMIYDLSGIKMNTGSDNVFLDRYRESQIIVSTEFGVKTGTGMVFIGLSWIHTINSYSGGTINANSNNYFGFNLGISLL